MLTIYVSKHNYALCQMFAKALRLAKELRGANAGDNLEAEAGRRPGAYFYSPSSKEWEKIRI